MKISNGMKKRLLQFTYVLGFFALVPVYALAAGSEACEDIDGLGNLFCNIQQLLNTLIPLLIALGVVYFVWGVVKFMIADSEEAKTKGKDTIIYGLIGFAVIIGLWGLVNIVVNTLGFSASELAMPTLQPVVATGTDDSCKMGNKFQGVLKYLTCIINNSIIPFIFAIAVVMFIWGAVKFFIINADEEAKREQGKQFMIWGIIALTVMIGVWGLVGILGSTFDIDGNVLPQVVPPGQSSVDNSIS